MKRLRLPAQVAKQGKGRGGSKTPGSHAPSQQRYGGGRPTTSISQPYKKTASTSQPKSGFFGNNKSSSSSSRSSFGSYGG